MCRCGWDGNGDHPCHFSGYTCGKPAKEFFYEPHRKYSLGGQQMKMSMASTFACEEHRLLFESILNKDK